MVDHLDGFADDFDAVVAGRGHGGDDQVVMILNIVCKTMEGAFIFLGVEADVEWCDSSRQ